MDPKVLIAAVDQWFKALEAKSPGFLAFVLAFLNVQVDQLIVNIFGTKEGKAALTTGFDGAVDYLFDKIEAKSPGILQAMEKRIGQHAKDDFKSFVASQGGEAAFKTA